MSQAPDDSKRNVLDRPVFGAGRITWWTVIFVAILVVIVLTRLWDLGSRAYCHDESIHAWDSWRLYTGQRYTHNPVYHGPFLYHLTALVYALFGHNDVTGRLATSLIGIAITLTPLLFRRWLGKNGVLMAMLLMAVSPVMMHRSRFIRHDHFAILANLVMLWAILQYLEKRQTKHLYWVAASISLGFTGKETTFITYFIFGSFLAMLYARQLWRHGLRSWRQGPLFDLLIVIGTLILPLASPLAIDLLGRDPVDYTPSGVYFSGAVFLVTVAISAGIGLWWDRRRWPICAGLFYVIFVPLFTSMYTNGQGFATGMVGQLGYWLSQHGVKRGGQPWFYYLVLFPLYEFLPILLGVAGAIYLALRGPRPPQSDVEALPLDDSQPEGAPAVLSVSPAPTVPLLLYWSLTAFALYSWAGEKMPWLMMHLAVPLHLLGGWTLAHLVEADWRSLIKRGALWLLLLIPLFVFTLGRVLVTRPVGGTTSEALFRTMAWITALLTALLLAAFIRRIRERLSRREGWRMVAASALVILLALTVRFAWMATFINADVANEFLVYAQGAPDVAIVARELTDLSQRLTGGLDLTIAYDSEVSWPFVWYLRDFTNAQYFGDKPAGPLDAEVVLVGVANEASVMKLLDNRYYRREYRLIWWPNQNWYMSMSPKSLWRDLRDEAARKKLWDVIFYRKHDVSLASWPFVNRFAMYIRRDIVQQLWDYGPETLTAPETLPGDEYTDKWVETAAASVWGMPGSGPGQFLGPKGVARDLDGNVYIADSQNHRIQVFDAQGQFVREWGGEGVNAGEFKEPWGVAVSADGTVYVADTWNHRIQVFDRKGGFLRMWGVFGEAPAPETFPGLLYGPRDVVVDDTGYVYVSDTGNKRVIKYDPYGSMIHAVGGEGSAEGQLLEPVGIAVADDGLLYVADTWNRRIQVFDAEGRFVRQWGVYAWSGMSVVNKPYLAVDRQGSVYATDPEGYRVLQFDVRGQLLASWGQYGRDEASMNLPTGIVLDASGRIFVSDSDNGRILVYR
jgi:uncharacterized protein (TIGR03663 family)